MNARQKVKKLKKENELLKEYLFKPSKIIVATMDQEHLTAQCIMLAKRMEY